MHGIESKFLRVLGFHPIKCKINGINAMSYYYKICFFIILQVIVKFYGYPDGMEIQMPLDIWIPSTYNVYLNAPAINRVNAMPEYNYFYYSTYHFQFP